MEVHIERDPLGGLFHQIITDMKNGAPLWEDFVAKATKLHSCLRAAIQAIGAYLDAFQKIADAATNARGATKEIGTALTRICLRHKAVEARMKTFTSAIMDCLVVPLQEKLEDWKKAVFNLDKEHAKDYKRARAELKKRSTDTLRLQKKARKGGVGTGSELQRRLECNLQDVTERRQLLEETEKQAVRAALIEERSRFCLFVGFMKPVVDEEVAMLSELTHLQEVVDQLQKHTADPFTLPPASEQVIADLKNSDSGWSFQTPPSSPSSLGSRKSSMCSISSLNSSSSGSSKSHHSPSHPHWHRSLSQPVARCNTLRLTSVSSRDSGFTSQDTLFPATQNALHNAKVSNMSEHSNNSSNSSTPCTPFPATAIPNTTATWPNLQESLQFERTSSTNINDRPHTISSAYEKGHQRPPLTVYTFQAPEQCHSQPVSPVSIATVPEGTTTQPHSPIANNKSQNLASRPPLPTRCSSLERPSVPAKSIAGMTGVRVLPPGNIEHKLLTKPTPLPAHIAKDIPQPMYVNMHELASMAASKAQEMNLPPPPPEFTNPASDKTPTAEGEKDGSTSESSLESSSGYGSQTTFPVDDTAHSEDVCNLDAAGKYCTLPRSMELAAIGARRRPVSMTAVYSSNTMRNTLLRRSSIQGNKPPPPIRRTASITNTNRSLTPVGSLENLPPPPAFLLEGGAAGSPPARGNNQPAPGTPTTAGVNVAETVKVLTELKHTPASPNSVRRMSTQSLQSQQIQQLQQQFQQHQQQLQQQFQQHQQQQLQQQQQVSSPSTPVLSSFASPVNPIYGTIRHGQSNTIYAQPSQLVPGSPSAVRRASIVGGNRSQSAERKVGEGPGGVGSGFIAALSAKLAPSLSPRNSRRHSEDLGPQSSTSVQQPPSRLVQRGPGQGFLDTLNAKLAQQHLTNSQGQLKANKIRQIINSKAQPDPTTCHESLMDQIKRGATLKKARSVNDRSAPKIY